MSQLRKGIEDHLEGPAIRDLTDPSLSQLLSFYEELKLSSELEQGVVRLLEEKYENLTDCEREVSDNIVREVTFADDLLRLVREFKEKKAIKEFKSRLATIKASAFGEECGPGRLGRGEAAGSMNLGRGLTLPVGKDGDNKSAGLKSPEQGGTPGMDSQLREPKFTFNVSSAHKHEHVSCSLSNTPGDPRPDRGLSTPTQEKKPQVKPPTTDARPRKPLRIKETPTAQPRPPSQDESLHFMLSQDLKIQKAPDFSAQDISDENIKQELQLLIERHSSKTPREGDPRRVSVGQHNETELLSQVSRVKPEGVIRQNAALRLEIEALRREKADFQAKIAKLKDRKLGRVSAAQPSDARPAYRPMTPSLSAIKDQSLSRAAGDLVYGKRPSGTLYPGVNVYASPQAGVSTNQNSTLNGPQGFRSPEPRVGNRISLSGASSSIHRPGSIRTSLIKQPQPLEGRMFVDRIVSDINKTLGQPSYRPLKRIGY